MRQSQWRHVWHIFGRSVTGKIGLVITMLLLIVAMIGPVLVPYDPTRDRNLRLRLTAPAWSLSSDERAAKELRWWDIPFGTDELGRDLFVRVLHGSRVSLTAGFGAVLLAILVGAMLGFIAGFVGGWFDIMTVWVCDVMLAFPSILLAIAIIAVRGPGLFNAILAVSIVEIPIFARIARASVHSVRTHEYILAAQALGMSSWRILFRHILPNAISPVLVQATLSIATAVVSIAALGFLGLGAQPPTPEWGTMLADGYRFLVQGKWWFPTFPGLAIMLSVFGYNLIGDALSDALDPRTHR